MAIISITVAPAFKLMNAQTNFVPIGSQLQFAWMERNYTRIQKTVFSAVLEFVTMLDAIVMVVAGKICLVQLLKRKDYLN